MSVEELLLSHMTEISLTESAMRSVISMILSFASTVEILMILKVDMIRLQRDEHEV